jgi:hypothetical protein
MFVKYGSTVRDIKSVRDSRYSEGFLFFFIFVCFVEYFQMHVQMCVTTSFSHILPSLPNRYKQLSCSFRESSTYPLPQTFGGCSGGTGNVSSISFRDGWVCIKYQHNITYTRSHLCCSHRLSSPPNLDFLIKKVNLSLSTPWGHIGEWRYNSTHSSHRQCVEASDQLRSQVKNPPIPIELWSECIF